MPYLQIFSRIVAGAIRLLRTRTLVSCRKRSLCANTWTALIDCKVNNRLHQHHCDRWKWTTVAAAQLISNKRWASHFQRRGSVQGTCSERALWSSTLSGNWDHRLGSGLLPLWSGHSLIRMLVTFLVQSNALDAFSVGGAVAAHIAHSITEVIECFLSGNNFNKPWTWQHQLLPSVRTFVIRPDVWKMQARESLSREAWHFFCVD